jgi:negative regulator of replication initiation
VKTLSIDDDLFLEIDKLATGIFTHSDVIRKLLSKSPGQKDTAQTSSANTILAPKGSVGEFVQGAQYKAIRKTGDRYLMVLGWIHKNRPEEFLKIEGYQRGRRKYFATSEKAITQSGQGPIKAKQIPKSQFWALVTLDSQSMRGVLVDVLRLTGFQPNEISAVAQTIQSKQDAISDFNIEELMA